MTGQVHANYMFVFGILLTELVNTCVATGFNNLI